VLYRSLLTVPPSATQTAPSAWIASAEQGLGGKVLQLIPPARPDQSAQMLVQRSNGEKLERLCRSA
jgi:hypothetical protein